MVEIKKVKRCQYNNVGETYMLLLENKQDFQRVNI
uniref:UBA-like domain protein n=1 Tax=Siphoviridae sp. ctvod4 TaxID=2827595 RepID=A0A8S5LLC4_9CAUD|nr:MAG TPA: UBA-like domain protein [Siphoviridae sp. ctvod4]DAI10566.1 MAG TPA: UBA-like domain protein [Caudoviricetes sp.]DAY21975.1 MAG TPA: UBA-like domain protein [Bacteriophage sp.]DAS91648.1 MAG TPA: UBA-like domain protein [Caudoviricetes sp.]DAU32138.1 MAG TPA: UBA-like domain protein [Caudoviricetes sp.]